jgi:hypothetical protein
LRLTGWWSKPGYVGANGLSKKCSPEINPFEPPGLRVVARNDGPVGLDAIEPLRLRWG